MQKYLYSLLILSTSYTAIAQKTVPDFGKISLDELKLSSCSFEAEATAMKLFDVQETEFSYSNYDSKLKTERRVRLKIFNERGYKHATIKIPYYSKKGVSKIKDLKGVVYNLGESGNIVIQKLEKKDFFKSKSDNNVAEIDFTFPNVKPGSVVEFSYIKIEKNILNIDPWIVQDELPTAYSCITITTPEESKIMEKVYGEDSVQQQSETNSGRTKKLYFKENIKPFRYEPFMSSFKDNLLRIVFMLIPRTNFFINALTSPDIAWNFTGSHLLEAKYFGGQIEKTIPGTEGLIDSAKKIKSIPERIKFIYDSVKKRTPDKIEQTLETDDVAEAWNSKNGTSTEINLILLNILQKANVASCAILVSTRDHGKINADFPSPAQFNGVDVLAADSNVVYPLDASLKWQSFQNPPANILNRTAFLLIKNGMKWVTITDTRPLLRQNILISTVLKEDGNLNGTFTAKYYDYAKSFILDSIHQDTHENQFVIKKPENLKIVVQNRVDPEKDSDPLEQQLEFEFETQKTGNFYFINPGFFSSNKQSPFINSTRNTDIDFGCNQQLLLTFLLSIPPTYQVESLPQKMVVRAPDSSFFYQRFVSANESQIYIQENFEIKRSAFGKEEYPNIQEFFKRIYALKAEEIILKKK